MTTPSSGRGTRYDHAQIRNVARQMRQELAGHAGPGALPDLASRGRPPGAAFGNWDAAKTLSGTIDQGNAQLTRAYQQFLDGFRAVAGALEKIADNYREADERTLANIRSVGSLLGRPPSTGPAPTRSTVQPTE